MLQAVIAFGDEDHIVNVKMPEEGPGFNSLAQVPAWEA